MEVIPNYIYRSQQCARGNYTGCGHQGAGIMGSILEFCLPQTATCHFPLLLSLNQQVKKQKVNLLAVVIDPNYQGDCCCYNRSKEDYVRESAVADHWVVRKFAGLPGPANDSKVWRSSNVSLQTSRPTVKVNGKLQEPEKGRMIENSDLLGRKVWITPPGKEPRAVGKENKKRVAEGEI